MMMATLDELQQQLAAWDGLNIYVYKQLKKEISALQPSKQQPSTFNSYKKRTVAELRVIAKKMGIKNYYKLKEDELIELIMEYEVNE